MLVPFNLTISPLYITSSTNQADPASWGEFDHSQQRLPFSSCSHQSFNFFSHMSRKMAEAHARAQNSHVSTATVAFTPPTLALPNTCVRWPHLPNKVWDHILPSPLHPHVLAGHCFLAWLTPFGIHSMNNKLTMFPDHLITCHRIIISQSVSTGTLSNY